jgi:hypothetical protein
MRGAGAASCACLLALLSSAALTLRADGDPLTPAPPAASASWRFRIGPLFEIGRDEQGVEVTAVRPLFSRVSAPAARDSVTDVAWPWSSFHRRDDYFHWWFLPAFGTDENVCDLDSRYSVWIVPLYCEGRTRDGVDYGVLFPLHGELRGFLETDELRFTLFPLFLSYRQGQQETESWLWPFFLRERGPKRERFRVFPLYGRADTPEEHDSFVLWPVWTQQKFDGSKQHGSAEMLFPVYGRVDTDRQHGWLAVPPFFSRMESATETRLRCPWPFYERVERKGASKVSVWPLWTSTDLTNGCYRRTACWPFWWDYRSERGGRREESTTLVPFYHQARSELKTGDRFVADLNYTRVWPLFSRHETSQGTRIRVPELTFMREGQGIERNWAPFWSWYVQRNRGDACDHDVFWGLARWGQRCDDTTYGQIGPLFSWSRPPGGPFGWQVLGGLVGSEQKDGVRRRRWLWFWHSGGEDALEQAR